MADGNQRIGDYEILAPLGAGGMGRVFKVRNVISNREEAMKVLLPDFAAQPELAARFLAEIRTLGTLEHPNIAQLRTAFQYQTHFVMVMEYVEGATLEKMASTGRIPLDRMLDYASQTLAGLSYAHSHGVTHRDIKPANIMITSHGVAKLMDFGIAKSTEDMQLTRPGTTMGSVYYMSPEQVQGGAIDARSDLYSFGVTLYEMFTGSKPFVSDSSYTVLNAQINEAPTPLIELNPELPVALNNIVLKAMAKDPAARFQDAEEFRSAIRTLREPQAAAPAPQTPAPVPVPVSAAAGVSSATAAMSVAQAVPSVAPAAPAPAFAPVPQVAAAAPAAQKGKSGRGSNRGLWIAMGAVAAVLAIVAVAALVPRFYPLFAGHNSAQAQPAAAAQPDAGSAIPAAASQPTAETMSSATQPTASRDTGSTPGSPAASSMSAPGSAPRAGAPAGRMSSAPPVGRSAAAAPPAAQSTEAPIAPAGPPEPSAQQVREARDRMMNMSARADSVRNGVQALRTQQQAQGLDIRGDILTSMNRMNGLLNEAQQSLNAKDLSTANEYMDRAEKEVVKLEAFLGH